MYTPVWIEIDSPGSGLKSVRTNFFKGMQYTWPVFDNIEAGTVPLDPWNYTLGQNITEVSRQAGQKLGDYSEYLVYSNMMNPLMQAFFQSRFLI